MSVFSRKKRFEAELEAPSAGTLTLFDLTAYGVAAVVGSGIFATVGRVALLDSGLLAPVSVLIAGGLSLCTAICYLEFASALPVSGSSYAYFYGMVGEVWGWAAGWNLTLEYAFAAAAIAGAWSDGLKALLELEPVARHLSVPASLFCHRLFGVKLFPAAALLVCAIGTVVSRGMKMGATLTNAVTLTNLALIVLIIAVGSMAVKLENWTTAPHWVSSKKAAGVVEGGSHMFFAYIGYDTVSTLSGDAASPARDVPRAVFATLAIATALYIGVVLVLTGMQRWEKLLPDSSLIRAFQAVEGTRWAAPIVSVGSLTTMAATVMACLVGQPKIFRSMADDGLLPGILAGTDAAALRSTVLLAAGLALLVDFNDPSNGINDAISFGVLLGMSAVCVALLVVRFQKTQCPYVARRGTSIAMSYFVGCLVFSSILNSGTGPSGATPVRLMTILLFFLLGVAVPFALLLLFYRRASPPRLSPAFCCPLMPLLPAVGILANSLVLMTLWRTALVPFVLWTGLGLLIYVCYGQKKSKLAGKSK